MAEIKTKLPSTLQDTQAINIKDYVETNMIRVYAYEIVTKRSVRDTLATNINASTIALITPSPIGPKDEVFFDALAEIDSEGALVQTNKADLSTTRFLNLDNITLITNGFVRLIEDRARVYTIGSEFDENKYLKGEQNVYYADINSTGRFSSTILQDSGITVPDGIYLRDDTLNELTLYNTLQWADPASNQRIIFKTFLPQLESPKIDVCEGTYHFQPFSTLRTLWFPQISIISGQRLGYLTTDSSDPQEVGGYQPMYYQKTLTSPKVLIGRAKEVDRVFFGGTSPTDPLGFRIVNAPYEITPKGLNNIFRTVFNLPLNDAEDFEFIIPFSTYDFPPKLNVKTLKQAIIDRRNALQSPVPPDWDWDGMFMGSYPQFGVLPWDKDVYTAFGLIPNMAQELEFTWLDGGTTTLGPISALVTNKEVVSDANLFLTFPENAASVNTRPVVYLGADYEREIAKVINFRNCLFDVSGFELEISSRALLSKINAYGIQDQTDKNGTGVRQDLKLESNVTVVPLLTKTVSATNHPEIQVPWFDTLQTMPFYVAKKASKLSDLFKNQDGTIDTDDLNVLIDLITITKLAKDDLKQLPINTTTGEIEFSTRVGVSPPKVGWNTQSIKNTNGISTLTTNLIKSWKESLGLETDSERFIRMIRAVTMLSRYIISDYSIAKGGTSFNAAHQPYYFKIEDSMLINPLDQILGSPTTPSGVTKSNVYWASIINPLFDSTKPANSSNLQFTNLANARLSLLSEHFNMRKSTSNLVSFVSQKRKNLSQNMVVSADSKYYLPEAQPVLTGQKWLSVGGDINADEDDALSTFMYLPISTSKGIDNLFLESEILEVNGTGQPVEKTVALRKVYSNEPALATLQEDIIAQIVNDYGIFISKDDILDYGQQTTLYPERNFFQQPDWSTNSWPQWIKNALAKATVLRFFAEQDGGYLGDKTIDNRIDDSDGAPFSLGVDNTYELSGNNETSTPFQKQILVEYFSPTNPSYTLDNIRITGTPKAELWMNRIPASPHNKRRWVFDINYTVKQVEYRSVKVKLPTDKFTLSEETRPVVFTKQSWYDFLENINQNSEIYDKDTIKIKVWTNKKISYLEQIDILGIFIDKIVLWINGVPIEVPSLNREDPTAVYQRIILPT